MEEWQLLTSAMEIDLALVFFGGGFLNGRTQLSAESPDGTQLVRAAFPPKCHPPSP